MKEKIWSLIKSSADEKKISLTLKSLLPTIIFALGFFGYVEVSQGDLVNLIEAGGLFISAGFTLYGAGRKIYLKLL